MKNTKSGFKSPAKISLELMINRKGSMFLTTMLSLVVLLILGSSFVQTSVQELARASRVRRQLQPERQYDE